MSRLASLLIVVGLGLGFLFSGTALSVPKKGATAQKIPKNGATAQTVQSNGATGQRVQRRGATGQRNKANKSNFAQVDAQLAQHLETIRLTLNKADHDYKGHRAAAVHQITHAIHMLQHGKQHPNPGQHFVAGKTKEPQATSDVHLKQALAALQSVSVPAGTHQAKVQQHIARAVTDLGSAPKAA